ncbi:MAG: class I SAM-dependent methyltransferase [Thermoanaerobaculia bacterium]
METVVAAAAPRSLRGAAGVFVDLLDRHLAGASLVLEMDGETVVCGARGERGAALPGAVRLRIHNRRFFSRVLGQGNLGMGEAFMDGDFTVEEGELHTLLTALLKSRIDRRLRRDPGTLLRVLGVQLANLARRHQWSHVQRHYDLGPELFSTFLDGSLTYSCGYAEGTSDDLASMQRQKLDRICRKLELRPGERLLDIGCGFGGLLIHAAQHYGVTGVGITNSQDHCQVGNERIAGAGLAGQIRLELRDHRSLDGQFDKVVSVGMLEHLPRREYRRYFSGIARVLAPQGLALVHAIGCSAPRVDHDPFIQKYIFPGSGQMLLSDVARELERHSLAIRDVENIVRHYAYTVLRWLEGFRENAPALDSSRYDGVFRRIWEYYFHCGIAGAFASDGAVYQVLFARDYAADMPLHRV